MSILRLSSLLTTSMKHCHNDPIPHPPFFFHKHCTHGVLEPDCITSAQQQAAHTISQLHAQTFHVCYIEIHGEILFVSGTNKY